MNLLINIIALILSIILQYKVTYIAVEDYYKKREEKNEILCNTRINKTEK